MTPETLSSGASLGSYVVLEPIGAGGMGEVYRGLDQRLGREVAIKVLPARFAASALALSRFEREARAVAALSHPNLLTLYDIGEIDQHRFVVTELLEGETLRKRIDRGRLPWREAASIAAEAAAGLGAAHRKGVVHRDFNPRNVFLTREGRVKILDFGLAIFENNHESSGDGLGDENTQPGSVIGTSGYISPEQVLGEPIDRRADLFALGCCLYEMLTAEKAFPTRTLAELVTVLLEREPVPLDQRAPGVPAELARIVDRCLRKRKEDRVASAEELEAALRALLAGELAPPEPRPSPPRSSEASKLFLKGRYFWNKRNAEGLRKARAFFQEALDLDPTDARAWVGLADAWAVQPFWGLAAPAEAFPKAKSAARRALALDPELAEAWASLAYVQFYWDWQWSVADASFTRATRRDPGAATALHWWGVCTALCGRFERAFELLAAAQEIDPLSSIVVADTALVAWWAGQNSRALEACRTGLELDERFPAFHLYRGLALESSGDFGGAEEALRLAAELSSNATRARSSLAHLLARSGQEKAARELRAEIQNTAERRYVSRYPLAIVDVGLGDFDAAFATLDRAFEERCETLPWLRVDPRLASLRAEERYQKLEKRLADEGASSDG